MRQKETAKIVKRCLDRGCLRLVFGDMTWRQGSARRLDLDVAAFATGSLVIPRVEQNLLLIVTGRENGWHLRS